VVDPLFYVAYIYTPLYHQIFIGRYLLKSVFVYCAIHQITYPVGFMAT